MQLRFNVALLVLSSCAYLTSACQQNYKLELLQVLFRHGDRSALPQEIYKTDPYAEVFKRIGYGQLTVAGKQREYKIGQVLRARYGDFLGDFNAEEVYAYSTEYDRTKMSLDLVLAGLYPPTQKTLWNEKILWSPVPTSYNTTDNDIFSTFYMCARYEEQVEHAEQLIKVQSDFIRSKRFFNYVERSTRIEQLTSAAVLYNLFGNLRAVVSLGLPLPRWCSKSDYDKISELAKSKYVTMTLTDELKRITTGQVVKRFLSNINDHDNSLAKKMKIYLYSAHDNNVATFNIAHNFTNVPYTPDYGSTIVVEKLRGSDGQVYLRMFMWTGVSEKWIPVKLQNCDAECPLKDYINLMKWVLPDEESEKCYTPNSRCKN